MDNTQPRPTQNLTKFWSNTRARFDSLAKKEPSMVYFCTDTHEIYKGEDNFTSSVKIVDALPMVIKRDTLYIIRQGTNAGGYIYPSTGGGWTRVLPGGVFTASSILTLEDIPIATQVSNGLLSSSDKKLYDDTVTEVKEVKKSYPVTIDYKEEEATKIYTFKQGNEEIGKVSIPKNAVIDSASVVFVPANTIKQDGEFLPEGKYLKLVFASETSDDVYISLADLASIYTPGDGIKIEDNKISLNVDTSNGLSIEDGKLKFDSSTLDVGSGAVKINTQTAGETEMPLEEVVNGLYLSSVWRDM